MPGMTSPESGRRQRFISVLSRWGVVNPEEGEADADEQKRFQQRVAWEKATLRRQGGYVSRVHNVWNPDSSSHQAETKFDNISAGEEQPPNCNLCDLHSIGDSVAFGCFLDKFRTAVKDTVNSYKTSFPLGSLIKHGISLELGITHYLAVYHALLYDIVKILETPDPEYGTFIVDHSVPCLACRTSLVLSQMRTLGALMHISRSVNVSEIEDYIAFTIEQSKLSDEYFSVDELLESSQSLNDLQISYRHSCDDGLCDDGLCDDGLCDDGLCDDGLCDDGLCDDGLGDDKLFADKAHDVRLSDEGYKSGT